LDGEYSLKLKKKNNMENTINSPLEAAKIIDRCLEIEKEYDSINKPFRLSYIADLEDEYRALNDRLGYVNRHLYDKSSRRTGM
jgi:hypothetical protein